MTRTIQVRHVPDDVHRTLRVRALSAGVSLSDYVLGEIIRVAARPPVAEVLTRAGSRSSHVDVEHVVDAVRAGRDRA